MNKNLILVLTLLATSSLGLVELQAASLLSIYSKANKDLKAATTPIEIDAISKNYDSEALAYQGSTTALKFRTNIDNLVRERKAAIEQSTSGGIVDSGIASSDTPISTAKPTFITTPFSAEAWNHALMICTAAVKDLKRATTADKIDAISKKYYSDVSIYSDCCPHLPDLGKDIDESVAKCKAALKQRALSSVVDSGISSSFGSASIAIQAPDAPPVVVNALSSSAPAAGGAGGGVEEVPVSSKTEPMPLPDALPAPEPELGTAAGRQDLSVRNFPVVPFRNFGNSCYLNATMQCFFSSPAMQRYFERIKMLPSENPLINGFFNLRHSVALGIPQLENYGTFVLRPFYDAVDDIMYVHSERPKVKLSEPILELLMRRKQHDPDEFINEFFNKFDRLENFPFRGAEKTRVICSAGHVSEGSTISGKLNINLAPSIQEAINNEVKTELLSGDNQYFCETCEKKVDATIQRYFEPAQELLILRLGREIYNLRLDRTIKDSTPIKVDERVTVDGKAYLLTGMILHRGASANSGHYIAFVRDTANPTQWWACNDHDIDNATLGIPNYFSGRTMFSFDVYMLFYEGIPSLATGEGEPIGTMLPQLGEEIEPVAASRDSSRIVSTE